jgi:hypothetical protein
MSPKRQKPNRGIVLLVVLSLLVIFMLAGVTFLTISSYYMRTAMSNALVNQSVDPHDHLLDSAMYMMLRDTNEVNCPIRGHSLLADMYGHDGFSGTIQSNAWRISQNGTGGQLIQLEFLADRPFTKANGQFNGNVVTFMNGPLMGLSGRIVYSAIGGAQNQSTSNAGILRLILPKTENPVPSVVQAGRKTLLNTQFSTFFVNGRAFNGTGFGFDPRIATGNSPYDPNKGLLTEAALYPNRAGQPNSILRQPGNLLYGGPDEPYDIADYQNMHLASMPDPQNLPIIPSFHRPALLNYHLSALVRNSGGDPDEILRFFNEVYPKISMRPVFQTEQSLIDADPMAYMRRFTSARTWDVDNDGDGVNDSIWIDLDFPSQKSPDGRHFKPIFSFLVLGMDGRLNVNAHGHSTPPRMLATQLYGNTSTDNLSAGQGYGPPEISLAPMLGNREQDIRLGQGTRGNLDYVPGRYADAATDAIGNQGYDVQQQTVLFEYPRNYFESPFILSGFGTPPDLHGELVTGLSYYGTLTTTNRLNAPNIDLRQNSPYELRLDRDAARGWVHGSDSPYTMAELERLLRIFDHDARRQPSRLTRLLAGTNLTSQRMGFTTDSFSVPTPSLQWTDFVRQTLRDLYAMAPDDTNNVFAQAGYIPFPNDPSSVPNFDKIKHLTLDTPNNFTALLAIRLAQRRAQDPSLNITPSLLNDVRYIPVILAPELMRAERMDINRPLGNGRLSSDETAVDVPRLTGAGHSTETVWDNATNTETVGVDETNVEFVHCNGILCRHHNTAEVLGRNDARSLMARHLFVLMMMLRDPNAPLDGPNGIVPGSDRETITRVLAQWSVNAVDFRDSDTVMTPFEYDIDPFNGWDVDGNIFTSDGDDNDDFDSPHPDRRVVWGCERPEMLLSESYANHFRNLEDSDDEEEVEHPVPDPNDMMAQPSKVMNPDPDITPDNDFDTRMGPRGSLIIEVYNPWRDGMAKPGELCRPAPGATNVDQFGIHLDKKTADGSPVWRVIVVKGDSHINRVDPDERRILTGTPSAGNNFDDDVERSIYFTDPGDPNNGGSFDPEGAGDISYFPGRSRQQRQVPPLLPGQYAVIGGLGHTLKADFQNNDEPAQTLLNKSVSGVGQNADQFQMDQSLRLELHPGAANVEDKVLAYNSDPATAENPVLPEISIVMDSSRVDGVLDTIQDEEKGRRRFSVTEPIAGYEQWTAGDGVTYDNSLLNGQGAFSQGNAPYVYDTPIDVKRANDPEDNDLALEALLNPVAGMVQNFRTVHLQRLANPGEPYHAQFNPYLTIDSMPVDVFVANGLEQDTNRELAANSHPPIAGRNRSRRDQFRSRERGETSGLRGAMNLWRQEDPSASVRTTSPPVNGYAVSLKMENTFGYLNTPFGQPRLANAATLGAPDNTHGKTFSAMVWNNRPYVSEYELMQVPKTSSSRLLRKFNIPSSRPASVTYGAGGTGDFPHLLNFYDSVRTNISGAGTATGAANHFYRLFELTHVPSRFSGTQTVFNPQEFTVNTPEAYLYYPPFNKISKFRDPGRVNINSLAEQFQANGIPSAYDGQSRTWDAVRGTTGGTSTYASLVRSIAGYNRPGLTSGGRLPFNDNIPTFFANPIRPPGYAKMVPNDRQRFGGSPNPMVVENDIDTTMMRRNGTIQSPGTRPLFENRVGGGATDANRNAIFRNRNYTRLGNMTTTQSNVFAVWITVAFFEVDPITGQLGQEMGTDTGDVTRHRAFYMVDRSIPVGFEAGKNHNVDKAITVRRILE